MSNFCPVCKNTINDNTIKCDVCNFTDLHREFITKEDAQEWLDNVVLPYRQQWEESKEEITKIQIEQNIISEVKTLEGESNKDDFDLFLGCLVKYKGNSKCISIPSVVHLICQNAFANCESVETINMSYNVVMIEKYAFDGCKNLKEVYFPKNLNRIEYGAFVRCESLREITIPNKIKKIEWRTFEGCKNLEIINMPDSVLEIEIDAFKGCNNLTIHCKQHSYAHKYATEHNIPVQFMD